MGAGGAEGQTQLIQTIALRRLGTPDDIVASDYAGWITGPALSVVGGP